MRITKRKLNSIISKIIIEEAARKGQSLKLSKRQLRRILSEAPIDEEFESDIGAEDLGALNPGVASAQSKGDVKLAVKNVKIRPSDNSEVYRYVETEAEYKGEESNIADKYYYALNDQGNFIAVHSKDYDPNTGKAKKWLSLKKYPGSLKKLKDALKNYLAYEDYILNLPDDEDEFNDPSDYPILMYVGTAGVSAEQDPTRGEVSDEESGAIIADMETSLPDGIYTLLKNNDTGGAGTFTVLDDLETVIADFVRSDTAFDSQAITVGRIWASLDKKQFDLLVHVKDGKLGVKQSYGENDPSGSNYTKFKSMEFKQPTKEIADAINDAIIIKSLKNYMIDANDSAPEKPYAILKLYDGTYDINVKKRGPGEVSSDDNQRHAAESAG